MVGPTLGMLHIKSPLIKNQLSYLAVDEEKRNGYDGQGKHCVVWRENNTKGCDFNVRRNLIEVR